MSVTLTLAKQHLRVETDDEDELILSYMDAATAWIERYCGENYDPYAPELNQAELLLIGSMYETREAAVSETPPAVEALAGPFRLPTIA